ncbi:MAG: ABC transporter permease subunit, partial [Verrucomicrobiales bacterium]|nr:ABC transporter permease subunit [Verrucomicrobiales bacterium]
LVKLRLEPTAAPVTELFYATPFFWLILLLGAPLITMRLIAQEKFSGTFETLMTTPVGDWQVVLAKFSAALLMYMLMWLPLLGCILFLRPFVNDPAAVDPLTVGIMFSGILLLGCLFVAIGCFASALTRNQIVAAMISFAISMGLFVLSFLSDRFDHHNGWAGQVLTYLALVEHMQEFARGIIDTRPVVLCLTGTVFFLFLTVRVIESRRWK